MDAQEAERLLSECICEGLDDESFGDSERGWWRDGEHIAEGYFGRNDDRVTMLKEGVTFTGSAARQLKKCGIPGGIRRNDTIREHADAGGKR